MIRRDGEGWFFEMNLADGSLDTSDIDSFPGADRFFDDASYKVKVKLPGRQVDHNGDSIDGDGFVQWDIDLLNPPARIFLRTEPGEPITEGGGDGGGGGALTAILVLLGLAALGALGYFLWKRNQSDGSTDVASADAAAAAPMPTAATASASPPSTPTVGVAPTTADSPTFAAPESPTTSAGSPSIEEATGQPVWDANRGAYVQWDPTNSRLAGLRPRHRELVSRRRLTPAQPSPNTSGSWAWCTITWSASSPSSGSSRTPR